MDILEKLQHSSKQMDKVAEKLDCINNMFILSIPVSTIVPKPSGFIYDESVEVVTLYQDKNVNIIYKIFHKKNVLYPLHHHCDSNELLFVTQGSFLLDVGGKEQILNIGDNVTIPLNTSHKAKALEDDSVIFAVCIPPENAYIREKNII